MAGLGPNGMVTTHPNCGEKICVGCEHWTGSREVTHMGFAATSKDSKPAFCKMKKGDTYPINVCSCSINKFEKWSWLK